MHRTPARPSLSLVLIAALSLASCGWGYATETYKAENRGSTTTTTYVQPPPPPPAVEKDPCEVGVFTLFMVEEGSRTVKELQCRTGQIVSLTRSDISETEYRDYRLQNIPVGKWYVLVDPKAERRTNNDVITNDHLLGVSEKYSFKYFQKLANTEYIIYTLEEQL